MGTNAMIDSPRSLGLARTMRAMPVALLLAAGSASAAEEQTINAFSVWNGEGSVYESGPHLGTFVGSISGTLFVQTEKGPTRGGFMVCPATRSEERRVGKECVSPCRSRGSPEH